MADFKASLGMEKTMGPVLGALLAEDYSDVDILGYTKSNTDRQLDPRDQEKYQAKLSAIRNPQHSSETEAAQQFVEEFSNTEEAHKYFMQWVDQKLGEFGKKTKVRFQSVYLQHLNDTEGIYHAANNSLNAVATQEGAKLVTLYLSPGTPVMAFVWAFTALRYPNLKKRLIASSNANKPPETITLPKEWLEWHGRQVKVLANNSAQYDVIFHLFGEQRMPNLLGVMQFPCKKHVFVNSGQYPTEVMKQFTGDAELSEVVVDPYDPENVRRNILDVLETMPTNIRIGFNLTGGTKLMYAGALAACRKINATPFYFEGRNNKVIYLNEFGSDDIKTIASVETFIKLNGDNLHISKPGHWKDVPGITSPQRKQLTYKLWNGRSKISKLYRTLQDYNENSHPFEISKGDIHVMLTRNEDAEIRIGADKFSFKGWPSFAQYLSGGWFEEFTYMQLEPFVESGQIQDLRIGLEVSFKESTTSKYSLSIREQLRNIYGEPYQELDLAFTDGRRLYVIECKAGYVNSEHVMKLQNIVRYFGGIEGRAILVTCFTPNSKVVRKKIDDSRNMQLVSGNGIVNQLETIIQSETVEQ